MPYDTTPFNGTISIYWFDVFNKPTNLLPFTLLKNVSIRKLKSEAHQRAMQMGLTENGNWKNAIDADIWWDFYYTREYLTQHGARRLVVIERS